MGLVTLDDKNLIQNKLTLLKLPFTEFYFPNIYLWRNKLGVTLKEEENLLLIEFQEDKQTNILPLDPVPNHLDAYKKILRKYPNQRLFPLPKEWADLFPEEEYVKETKAEWNDYVYQTKKLASYCGRALDGKRNHVKHFLHDYQFEIRSIDKNIIPEVLHILEVWKSSHETAHDYEVCKEALEQFEKIDLQGYVVLIEGKGAGFIAGSFLNQNMFDVLFAKAVLRYRGIYPFLFQTLAKSLSCEWINMEDDVGLPNIRKNKLEYAPDHLAVKWSVRKR